MKVFIDTSYLGAKWSSNILKDWDVPVTQTKESSGLIIISDDQRQRQITQIEKENILIVLKDVDKGAPHQLSQSGVLSTFGQQSEAYIPKYLVETVIANSIAIICLQLLREEIKPKQKVFHISVIEILSYFGTFFISAKSNHLISSQRGTNLLQGGAPFYSVYKCKQGFVAVGNLEQKFYHQMIEGMGLSVEKTEFWKQNQLSVDLWPEMRKMFCQYFLDKTASQWEQKFRSYDTCITQIKSPFRSKIRQPKILSLRPRL